MAHKTTVEWRKGDTGGGGTYTFSPNPTSITRPMPSQRKAEFFIPNLNGSVVQTMGKESRKIMIVGAIYVYPPNFDNLMTVRTNMESGIGDGIGQLHIISPAKHIYYKGILNGQFQWGEQTNMAILDYRFDILCADTTEYTVP